jgi:uncharacterized RDD family membrane protein YckC
MKRPGEVGVRTVARIIDFVPLLLIGYFVIGAYLRPDEGDNEFLARVLLALANVSLWVTYFVVSETQRGQTLGKFLMRLRVEGPDGGRPTFGQALLRNSFLFASLLPLVPFLTYAGTFATIAVIVGIFFTVAADEDNRRGWHDRVAGGTTVVKLG